MRPAGQNGITIKGAGVRVTLEGLTVNGTGGDTGIRMVTGSSLTVSRCRITNMAVAGIGSIAPGAIIHVRDSLANNNSGIGLFVTGATRATVDSSVFSNNTVHGVAIAEGSSGTMNNVTASSNGTYGVSVHASDGWSTVVTIENSQVHGNVLAGIDFGTTGNGVASGDVSRTMLSKNGRGITAISSGGTGLSYVTATSNVVSENTFDGLMANGLGAIIAATANTISRHGAAGMQGASSGAVYSSSDNALTFNSPNVGANVFPFGKN